MKDGNKTKAQLITELTKLRQQVADLQSRPRPLEAEKVERERVENLMRAQRDLGLALNAATGLDETLRLCVEAAILVSGMDSGGLYLVDEKTGSMDLVYHQGLPPDFIKRVSHFDADSPNARRISSGEPIYTRHQELGVPVSEAKRREGLRALAVIPVSCEDRIVACLNVASHTLDEVPNFARTALETIGVQIGNAVVRSKMEETLREKEERFRTLFEGAPDAIFLADPESGEILDANPAASRLLQKPHEEIIGLHQSQLHPPQLKNDVKKGFAEHARQKGETRPIRGTVLCADGNEIPVEVLAQTIHIKGKPVLQGIFRDITQRARAEQALRVSEQQYRTTLDLMGDAVHVVDADLRLVLFNAALIRWSEELGLETDVIGRRLYDVFPFLSEEILDEYRQVFETGKILITEEHQKIGDREFISEVRKIPVFDDGQVDQVVTVVRDITERVRMERALRASEQLYRTTLDSMGDAIHVIDPDLQFVLINATFIQWNEELGLETDVIGRRLFDIFPFLPDQVLDEYHQVFETGKTLVTEEKTTIINREFITETRKIPVFDNGQVDQVVTVVRDITQRKQAEQDLKESNRRLEATLAELRATQEQVLQKERLAAVGQLAAGIAHEFNNILASMVLYTEMSLRTPDLLPKLRQRLETIAQQSQRATDLVQQILDFGRRAMLDREPLDLALLLEKTRVLLERTLPKDIYLDIVYGPDEYRIHADASRVQQAIVNLVLNARDAMPEGGELHIGLERLQIEEGQKVPLPEMKSGEWVRVSVTDTGTGIPPDVLPRIYEPFFTTRAPLGHGLGLAQVYGIVRQHEGHINVQTEVGRGTTFTLYWPALPAFQPETPALLISSLAQGQGETILVVEDDSAMRVALVDTLETLNYRAISATNGQEALTILQEHKGEISLVLSDWVMPVMGGAELARTVKERQLGAKVLMLTGHSLDKAPKDVEPDVVVGWLRKPPSFEQLAQIIAGALEGNR